MTWETPTPLPDAVNLIDAFLAHHKERGSFPAREVVDIMLDVRSSIQNDRYLATLEPDPALSNQ